MLQQEFSFTESIHFLPYKNLMQVSEGEEKPVLLIGDWLSVGRPMAAIFSLPFRPMSTAHERVYRTKTCAAAERRVAP